MATSQGLHRLDTDKKRFERWEITAAKIYALTILEDSILGLPARSTESDDLLFQKLNSSLFRDFLVDHLEHLRIQGTEKGNENGQPVLALDFQVRADEVEFLLKAFDDLGNAGEQPKDEEEVSRRVEEADGAKPSILNLLRMAGSFDLSPRNLHAISEWCLDELEKHGNADSWQLPTFGEGAEIMAAGRL